MRKRQVLSRGLTVTAMAGLLEAWPSSRAEAGKGACIMPRLVGRVKKVGLSLKANGKTLKGFKLRSDMVIIALSVGL